jgi:hypothetical protein
MADAEKVDLYNPNDGLTGRDGGPYLDLEEARLAEERRARAEGRKPDYSSVHGYAGMPLVTAAQLVRDVSTLNVPSRDGTPVLDEAASKFAASDNVLATAITSVKVDTSTEPPKEEKLKKDETAASPDGITPAPAAKAQAKTTTEKKGTVSSSRTASGFKK